MLFPTLLPLCEVFLFFPLSQEREKTQQIPEMRVSQYHVSCKETHSLNLQGFFCGDCIFRLLGFQVYMKCLLVYWYIPYINIRRFFYWEQKLRMRWDLADSGTNHINLEKASPWIFELKKVDCFGMLVLDQFSLLFVGGFFVCQLVLQVSDLH